MKEYKYKINGLKFTVAVGDVTDNEVKVEVNGTPYVVELEKAASSKPSKPALSQSGKAPAAQPQAAPSQPVKQAPVVSGGSAAVKSPLPGTILSFPVKVGDVVKSGDTVCVLEAMKMENDIHTSKGGTVKQILVNVGDSVLDGADIMIIE
ncbi:MAG: acetyl-CoA carboxylase biotin carboxyl carrier protein subunit [Muribaculaceae bacterium]|nr:acetyl-CoA carboxylase biotin carboxyl carrier protein subunit [Muribaculaceae bacterium]